MEYGAVVDQLDRAAGQLKATADPDERLELLQTMRDLIDELERETLLAES